MDAVYGEPLSHARLAVILAHGRGAGANDLLPLAEALVVPGAAFLLPQAPGGTWYPYPFTAPIASNEPWLSRSLEIIARQVQQAVQAGLTHERIVLGGFSQGACLTLEFAARQAAAIQSPWGGLLGLSGGLIGPPGGLPAYEGRLEGTHVLLGCSDTDPHIPKERVEESARIFTAMGASVTLRLYPGLGHTIHPDEIDLAREILTSAAGQATI